MRVDVHQMSGSDGAPHKDTTRLSIRCPDGQKRHLRKEVRRKETGTFLSSAPALTHFYLCAKYQYQMKEIQKPASLVSQVIHVVNMFKFGIETVLKVALP